MVCGENAKEHAPCKRETLYIIKRRTMMYAIQNKRTKKWVYGTDFRSSFRRAKKFCDPPNFYRGHRQRTSFDMALTWDDLEYTKYEFFHRGCGADYEIVEVQLVPVRYLNVDFTWKEAGLLV